MDLVTRAIGPLQTNVHLVADGRTHEAIVIDAAIPGLPWISGELEARGWRLALIVSTHGHWDHAGENAALQAWSREAARAGGPADVARAGGPAEAAPGAATPANDAVDDRARSTAWRSSAPMAGPAIPTSRGEPRSPPTPPTGTAFSIPSRSSRRSRSRPASRPRSWPRAASSALATSASTSSTRPATRRAPSASSRTRPGSSSRATRSSRAGGGGWICPGGDPAAMVESLARLGTLPDALRVLPGHGAATTIGRERPWLEMVARERRLPL